MTTAAPPRESAIVSSTQPRLIEAPLDQVFESPFNTRRHFSPESLQEMADSLKAKGQLTPGLARPRVAGGYELAAGARRRRGLEQAGMPTILLIVRDMTDVELVETISIENLQREDITALEEAQGYQTLLHLPLSTYTVETLAAKVGKSEKYIYDRLKLLELGKEAQKDLQSGKLTASHGILLARLDHEQQKQVLKEARRHSDPAEGVSVRQLNHQIEQTIRQAKRMEEIELEITKAKTAYPDAKKIYKVTEFGSYGVETDFSYGAWKEVPADTPKALVGVLVPDTHSLMAPKLIHFEKVDRSSGGGGSRSAGPAYGSKEWKEKEREATKRREAREKVKSAAEIGVRTAFAQAAPKADNRIFLLQLLNYCLEHEYLGDGAFFGFLEVCGITPPESTKARSVGYEAKRDDRVRAALGRLDEGTLKAGILYLIVDPPIAEGKNAGMNLEEKARTDRLAKLLKIDMDAVGKAAQKAAVAAAKAQKAKAPSAKLRPKARPKAKVKRAKKAKRATR